MVHFMFRQAETSLGSGWPGQTGSGRQTQGVCGTIRANQYLVTKMLSTTEKFMVESAAEPVLKSL
jgi:hypothetical protein